MSNAEIDGARWRSLRGTVKRHLDYVYAKLSRGRRMDAAARALGLGLLGAREEQTLRR